MRMILTTCPKKESDNIRKIILESRLAGCALSLKMDKSMFFWEGKIDSDEESLLVFKTTNSLAGRLFDKIREVHPYKTPFIAEVDIFRVNKEYEEWLESVSKKTD